MRSLWEGKKNSFLVYKLKIAARRNFCYNKHMFILGVML